MKSLMNALQKLTDPQAEENFKLGVGKGKGKPTKKAKGNAKNPAAEKSVGQSGKYMKLIGAC